MRLWNVPRSNQVIAQAPGLGKDPVATHGAPILLSSELGVIAAGSNAVFPVNNLQPGNRTPYWIDEVSITIGYSQSLNRFPVLPAALNLFFQTGDHKVTRTAVPAMLFGPIWGTDELQTGLDTTDIYANFRWPLPKPLYMPTGDVLQCNVERDATLGSTITMVNAAIAYRGRACAPGETPPAKRHVPWVSHYRFPFSTAVTSYAMTNDEFRNPFLVPLMVQRLIARQVQMQAGVAVAADEEKLVTPTGLDGAALGQGALAQSSTVDSYCSIKMQDSLGYMIVPNFTPIGTVIDPVRAAWTFNRKLSAREKIAIEFQSTRVGTLGAQHLLYDNYVSMIGYREENV